VLHTKITGLLDAAGVAYRRLPHDAPAHTVELAARQRDVVPETMVKSILLVDGAGRYVLACVPGHRRVDPQAVRAYLIAHLDPTWRRLQFAGPAEIEAVTGCVQGAVAPLGLPPGLPVILDPSLAGRPKVSISSGDLMLGLEMDPADLIRLSGARLAPIAKRD
jgi:Cys-tRNA(Pro)/Cys-tRNA(Cys) deacylase